MIKFDLLSPPSGYIISAILKNKEEKTVKLKIMCHRMYRREEEMMWFDKGEESD